MQTIQCSLDSITNLTPYVYKVLLKPNKALSFKPGQYLQLVLAEKDKRAFSIANSPNRGENIELHIGAGSEDSYAMGAVAHLREALENNSQVTIEAPAGEAYLREDSARPVLLVAGGTGFTYTKSIADYLLEYDCKQPVFLYWGLRDASALYDVEHWQQMHQQHHNFTFVPVIENAEESWLGKTGNLLDAVLADFSSLAEYDVYCAGRFEMVGKARDTFLEKGLPKEHIYGDAFAFIK